MLPPSLDPVGGGKVGPGDAPGLVIESPSNGRDGGDEQITEDHCDRQPREEQPEAHQDTAARVGKEDKVQLRVKAASNVAEQASRRVPNERPRRNDSRNEE